MNGNVAKLPDDAVANALELFPGAKVVAMNKPLFCTHCDKGLVAKWERVYPTSSAKDLVALLAQRRGRVIERVWLVGRRDWACHFCGRAAG